MRKLPYQSSLQFIQRPQLLWNDIGDRKLWRGIQWIRRGPTVPSRLSWNAYQSNIPKPRSGVRWKHGMRRFSEYGNVASRMKRTKDHEHNGRKFDMILKNDRTYKKNGMTWRKKGRKLKWQESKMKGTWKEDEKENETNGKGNQRNIRRTWKNKRKGGKLNKVNVKQRYDWRK